MKKFFYSLFILIFCLSGCAYSNEIEEDYLDIAANYCVVGDYPSAIEYLDKILKINPSNKTAADLKKGLSHVIAGDKTSFIENINQYVKRAMEYKRAGDIDNEYKTLIDGTNAQNSYIAYYYLGNFYREQGNYSQAIDAYNASVSARSDFAPAYLSSAIVLLDIGKYESVINSIDKYLTFNPNDDLAYAIKSRAEFSLGFIQASKLDNEKALSLNNCPDYLFDRAKIMYKEGEYRSAKNLFVKLLKDIQTSKIYEYMGLCDYALGDYYSALNDFDKAILLSNDDEYLEARYNEIKAILENKNEKTENE